MAAKKKKKKNKSEKKKDKKPSFPQKKKVKKAVAAPQRKPKPKPAVVAADLPMPPVVISFELIAQRAFLIWERKTHTNYPEQNWKEAEAELMAELLADGE
jgi:LAS superfamily LD-carboxypeptidase LdcB